MTGDRDALFHALRVRITTGDGRLDGGVRRSAAAGDPVSGGAGALVDTIRRHAYRIADGDVADLLAVGWTQDEVFELTVATALGECTRRMDLVRHLLSTAEVDQHAP